MSKYVSVYIHTFFFSTGALQTHFDPVSPKYCYAFKTVKFPKPDKYFNKSLQHIPLKTF
jgi:hypothetical protein